MALDFGNMQKPPEVETPPAVDAASEQLMNSVQETIKGEQEVLPPEIQVADASSVRDAAIMQPVTPEEKRGVVPGERKIESMQEDTQQKFSEVKAATENILQKDYGSFISQVDLSLNNKYKTRMDADGKYYNVYHVVLPNTDVAGIEGTRTYKLQDGLTEDEIEKTINKRNNVVRGSGDLTYQPDEQNVGLATVYAAEELTVTQMMRGMFNTAPFSIGMTAGRRLYQGYGVLANSKYLQNPTMLPFKKFIKNVGVASAIGTGIYATGMTYGLVDKVTEKLEKEGISQFSSKGWAHLLFEIQQKELEIRKLDPNHVDIEQRPRTLTVEQFASVLDPKFAKYWTKLANTLSENGAATFTFGLGTRTMGFKDLDVLNIFTKGNNARMQKYHNQAIENLKNADKKWVATGLKVQTPTSQRITNEIKKIIDAEELADQNEIFTAAARFIVGFERQQVGQKLLSPRKWLLEIGGGEFGAGVLTAAAAEYNWYGSSARTEDIDKLGFVLAGATLFPNALSFVPTIINSTMLTRGSVGAIEGISQIGGMLTKKLSDSVDPKGRTQLARYLSDSPDNVSSFFTFVKGDKSMLPADMPDDIKKVASDLRRQILRLDSETGGKVIDNMQASAEITEQVSNLAARLYPNNPDAKAIFMEDSLGVFTGLEVIGALEDFLVNSVTKNNSVKLNVAQLKLQTSLVRQKEKALEKASKLYEDLLRMDVSTLEGDAVLAHQRMTNAVAETLELNSGRTAEMSTFMDQALAMTANNAFKKLVNNPYEGQHEVEEVLNMLKTEQGQRLSITIDGTELTGTDAIRHMISQVQQTLDDTYLLVMDGRRVLADDYKTSGKTRLLSDADQYNGTKIELNSTNKLLVSAQHFGATMNGVRIAAKAEKNRLYAAAFDNPEDATIDVTQLYARISDDIDSVSSAAAAGSDISKSTKFARRFFSDAIEDSVSPFIKTLGQGDYKKGIKVLKKLGPKFKELGVVIPSGSYSDINKLSKALFSSRTVKGGKTQIEAINGVLSEVGLSELRLMIPTPEYLQGMSNLSGDLLDIKNAANRGKQSSKDYVGDTLLSKILNDLDTEANVKNSTRNEEAFNKAYEYYTETYLPMVKSKLWDDSFGGTTGFDFSADTITKLSHKNGVHTWLGMAIKRINPEEPLSAVTFMEDFRAFFGKDPDAPAYRAAIAALDDTLIEMGPGTRITSDFLERPSVTGLSEDATRRLKEGDSEGFLASEDALLPDKVGFRAGTGASYATPSKISTTLSTDKRYDKVSRIVEALENTGLYTKGQASNIFDKVNRAIRQGGPEAQKAINDNLDIVAKQIELSGAKAAKLKGQFKSWGNSNQMLLQNFQKKLSSPKDMVEEMLNNPQLIDTVRDSFLKNSEDGEELFRRLWAEGMLELTQKGSFVTKADDGLRAAQDTYDPLAFGKLLKNNQNKLTKIFGADHVSDMILINQLLLRQHKSLPTGYGGITQQITFAANKGANFVYGPASVISRLYAANSGRTSYRYIGAEAVAAMLVNSDNKLITSLMSNPKWAKGFREFMMNPKQTMDSMSANTITWLHELAGAVSATGEGLFIDETSEDSNRFYFNEQVDKILARGKENYKDKEPRSVLDPITQKEQLAIEEATISVGAENRADDYGAAIRAVEGIRGFAGQALTDFDL